MRCLATGLAYHVGLRAGVPGVTAEAMLANGKVTVGADNTDAAAIQAVRAVVHGVLVNYE